MDSLAGCTATLTLLDGPKLAITSVEHTADVAAGT